MRSAPPAPRIFIRQSWTGSPGRGCCSPVPSPPPPSARRRGPLFLRGVILTAPVSWATPSAQHPVSTPSAQHADVNTVSATPVSTPSAQHPVSTPSAQADVPQRTGVNTVSAAAGVNTVSEGRGGAAESPPAGMSPALDRSLPTLGRIFASAGYETAYFGKWHLGGTPAITGSSRTIPRLTTRHSRAASSGSCRSAP